MFLFMQ